MQTQSFVDAHSPQWSTAALALTKEYFLWMNGEFKKTFHFSIEDLVGMSLDAYILSAMEVISPKNQPNSVFQLLISNNQPVAMGGLRPLPSGHGEVVRIYTSPQYRGQGFGRAMLEHIIQQAKDFGFPVLNLDTAIFMKEAQSMYKAHGFVPCEPYEGAEPPLQLRPHWLYMKLDLESIN